MMTRKLSDQVDAMIAPSGKIERILEGYRVSCPVSVVPSGIDTEKYRRRIDDGSREALRERYGIKEDEIVFVYVGRIAKEKNIEELLWYQKSVQKNIKLVLVGDGPYRTTLEEKAKEFDALQDGATAAAKRGYVDNVISGSEIRKHLIYALQMFGMR